MTPCVESRSRVSDGWRCRLVLEAGFDGGDEPRVDRALIEAAGFSDGEHPFEEATSGFAQGSEGELAVATTQMWCPGGTQSEFRHVVCRFDPGDFDKRPEPVAVVVHFAAYPHETFVAAEPTAQPQTVHRFANRLHLGLKRRPRDLARLVAVLLKEHGIDRPLQVETQSFHLAIVMVDQRLDVSFEMHPAPLESFGSPVHFRPAAVDDPAKLISQTFRQSRGRPAGENDEHGEASRNGLPQPGLLMGLLRRRFDHRQRGFVCQRGLQIVIRLRQRRGSGFCIFTVVAGRRGMFSRSARNRAARRLLCRRCPISNPVKKSSRSPNRPIGTPSGSAAHVLVSQPQHVSRCR